MKRWRDKGKQMERGGEVKKMDVKGVKRWGDGRGQRDGGKEMEGGREMKEMEREDEMEGKGKGGEEVKDRRVQRDRWWEGSGRVRR